MPLTITKLRALEILDSRGNPTVAAAAELSDGTIATAHVPSGASTGTYEALELRDGDPSRYGGKGVARAVAGVNGILCSELTGRNADEQSALDYQMREIDGTPNKGRLGANALLAVSCAVARAVAHSRRIPLWAYLAEIGDTGAPPSMPVPMVNILSGGLHAGRNIEFQDFLVIAHGFPSTAAALEGIVAVHRTCASVLAEQGFPVHGVADEGGWGPHLPSNEHALRVLTETVHRSGHASRFSVALDVAASHFHAAGSYALKTEDRMLSSEGMNELLAGWCERYPVRSIEDGLAEDDWEGWRSLTARLGSRVQLVGDDLFTTNPARLRRGIDQRVANAVLVKMNQIGTLSETFDVIRMARRAGYRTVISARSGETEDSFLADLAVGCGGGQIKIGSVTRSERLAKYNRLLEIEAGSGLPYASFT